MDTTTSRAGVRAWGAGLAAVVLVALGACEQAGDGEPVGELVSSWGQGDQGSWVDEVMPIETVAITSDAEREQWLRQHARASAPDRAFDDLRAVDLTESFVVVGGYSRCTEYSTILLEDDGAVRFKVSDDEPDTLCGWSPYTIDAWEVPLAETGGVVPEIRHGESSGGGVGDSDPEHEGLTQVGVMLRQREELGIGREELQAVVEEHGADLLTTAEERDALADALDAGYGGDGEASTDVRDVDMESSMLLLVGYYRCTEYSEVFVEDADPNLVHVHVHGDENTACAMSPYTLDMWVIDRADLGDDPQFAPVA